MNATSTVLANLELAKPLTRTVAAFTDKSNAKPVRVFFALIWKL
jgi:hypothetical protein